MNKKLVFMVMLIVSLALCFFSCDPVPFAITITDIPSTSGYTYGYVGLGKGNDVVAVSLPVPISGGKFTGELVDAKSNGAFADIGTYTVILSISSDTRGQDVKWSGAKLNTKVDGDISLKYNQFSPLK